MNTTHPSIHHANLTHAGNTTINNNNSTDWNYTKPAECHSDRTVLPGQLYLFNDWNAVPIYQYGYPHRNLTAVLASCCPTSVWILKTPKPCTAVCNATSPKQANEVANCLDLANVDYGTSTSGAMGQSPPMKSLWAGLVVGGLVLSGLFL